MMTMGIRLRAVVFIAIAAGVSAVMSGQAEAQTQLPPVIVTAPAPKSTNHPGQMGGPNGEGSADTGGDGHSLDRLNEQLKRKVDETNPVANIPPLDARSPGTKTGVVNIPGVQQQYGKNFGNSVVPYRPGAPVFTSPLGPRR
jgi:hypothetical protein